MTMTIVLDLDSFEVTHHSKYLATCYFVRKLTYCRDTQTDTHSGPTVVSGPLKRSIKKETDDVLTRCRISINDGISADKLTMTLSS